MVDAPEGSGPPVYPRGSGRRWSATLFRLSRRLNRRTDRCGRFAVGQDACVGWMFQKTVLIVPISRRSSTCVSATTGSTVHLSKAVHGWEIPHRTTSPVRRSDDGSISR